MTLQCDHSSDEDLRDLPIVNIKGKDEQEEETKKIKKKEKKKQKPEGKKKEWIIIDDSPMSCSLYRYVYSSA